MEGRPSIRVKLRFHDNPHGADPVADVGGVLAFPGRGHKGVVKPGQLWECDVVFASSNYVMVAPRVELQNAADGELGVLRLFQGAREVGPIELPDVMGLLRSGQVPRPAEAPLPPRPLTPRSPLPSAPAPPPRPAASTEPAAPAAPPPPLAPVPVALQAAPATSTPSPRTTTDWRHALEGPDARALVALLAERLGLTTNLPRIEATLEGQEEILGVLRGESGEVRKSIKDLGAQIEEVRKQVLTWRRKENQDFRGVPKPAPKDPDHPTDDEIEREIVHQLYQKNCWGNKYGQYEKLKRGYNNKASDRQVRAAVDRLEKRRWIVLYPKETDQFRLNPARAGDIYRFLGLPDRAAEQLAEETRDEIGETAPLTQRDLDDAMGNVATRLDVERALAPLRQKLAALEDRALPALPVVEQAAPRNHDLDEIRSLLRGLQGEINRVKKLAEDTASAQARMATQGTSKRALGRLARSGLAGDEDVEALDDRQRDAG